MNELVSYLLVVVLHGSEKMKEDRDNVDDQGQLQRKIAADDECVV